MKRIAIFGLGLIGSSLSRKLIRLESKYHVIGCTHSAYDLEKALSLGIIHEGYVNPVEAVEDIDVIVLCTPLSAYGNITKDIAGYISNTTVITDVGSVKEATYGLILPYLDEAQRKNLVPAHPIAGSERSGMEAGIENLYENKTVIVTPEEWTSEEALLTVMDLWKDCGSIIETMDASKHDEIFAETSHVIQLIAYAYILYLGMDKDQKIEKKPPLLEEFIRLGLSNPVMWRDICIYNKRPILLAIRRIANQLASLTQMIQHKNMATLKDRFNQSQLRRKAIEDTDASKNYSLEDNSFNTGIFPFLLASVIMETILDLSRVGSGFRSLTASAMYQVSLMNILNYSDNIANYVARFTYQLELISDLIQQDEAAALEEKFRFCHEIYHDLFDT